MLVWKKLLTLSLAVWTIGIFLPGAAEAQEVDAALSTREAYVGVPVILQVRVANATDYQMPEPPEIDGCRVRSRGAPSQSSQITIINGRRTETRSVTLQYAITPLRAGTFEVPPLTVEVDGRSRQTQSLRFVATRSETGDLLFAEIEGRRDQVYVGQPLDLTLKIWIKPYQDRTLGLKLSEGQMWQLISQNSAWGSFADRMQELAENNQRPGGREVLRDDGQGNERSYYLYEIDATIYPTRAGKIDASDVQIVVNYPTEIGKARDPFDEFFNDRAFDRAFGGSSLMRQMMDDDFFDSPFRDRLAVKSARPIVADVSVDSTRVLPVPTRGRPDDYRGAVGQYRIVSEAEPTKVSAGDPITLRIGIVGDGPMELVQAPPLWQIPEITKDFKVTDQSLAGFVEGDTKVFSTTLRPRREGIEAIPPIPFSYFDPESESFETAYSQPISISVDAAETLSLDSIVGQGGSPSKNMAETSSESAAEGTGFSWQLPPQFENHQSLAAIESESSAVNRWWLFASLVIPPVLWMSTLVFKLALGLLGPISRLGSAKSRVRKDIDKASDRDELHDALVNWLFYRTRTPAEEPVTACLGVLRMRGLSEIANRTESLLARLAKGPSFDEESTTEIQELKRQAREWVEMFDRGMKDSRPVAGNRRVQRPAANWNSQRTSRTKGRGTSTRGGRIAGLVLVASMSWNALDAVAARSETANTTQPDTENTKSVELDLDQRRTLFQEANSLYVQARNQLKDDQAEAAESLSKAAEKYQVLVDAGIHNAKLFQNLGNARLHQGHLGQAIANYRRGLKLNPADRQLAANLDFARSQVEQARMADEADLSAAENGASVWESIQRFNRSAVGMVGLAPVQLALAVASIGFWGLVIVRTFRGRRGVAGIPLWRWAAILLFIMVVTGGSLGMLEWSGPDSNAVVVTQSVELRSGDGTDFDVVHAISSADGLEGQVVDRRGGWIQIELPRGRRGWVKQSAVEVI